MKNIKFISVILFLLISNLRTFAFEIIYPKSNLEVINSSSTFFVGNEDPTIPLMINDKKVELNSDGAFFFPVDLVVGENIFKIENEKTSTTYSITRPKIVNSKTEDKIIHFDKPEIRLILEDNTPLRSIPYDGGITRLQHLQKGIPLKVVGEFKNFYQVQLARDDYVWVDKKHLSKVTTLDNNPAKIENFSYLETATERTFTLKLNKKVPYILSEEVIDIIEDNNKYVEYAKGLDLELYNVSGYPENIYQLHINPTNQLFGFKSYYKNNNELVIIVKKTPTIDKITPLKDIRITIDAGHGGSELGAIGCLGDYEKDINLAIAKKLKTLLQNSGAIVFMTRDDDKSVSLTDRVNFSNKNNTDIFISIHNNALPDSAAYSGRTGSSTYYYYLEAKPLVNHIQKALVEELGMNDDKKRQESFAVVRNSESIAILIEIGYLINPKDNAKLRDTEFQEQTAKAILHGLENYLNELPR